MRWVFALLGLGLVVALVWAWLPAKVRSDASAIDAIDREPDTEPAHEIAVPDAAVANALSEVANERAPAPARSSASPAHAVVSSDFTVIVRCPEGEDCGTTTVHVENGSLFNGMPDGWSPLYQRRLDSNGRARFPIDRVRDTKCVRVWAASDDGVWMSMQPQVFVEPRAMPSETTLHVERSVELHVVVRAADDRDADEVHIEILHADGQPRHNVKTAFTDGRAETSLRVPRGTYEIVARETTTQTTARVSVNALKDQRITLNLPVAPLAVAGVVLDESGRRLPNVPLVVRTSEPRARHLWGKWTSTSLSTGADGTFELRAAPCEEVDVSVSSDPFLTSFKPSTVRVAHGTTDVVMRRERGCESRRLRLHVVDSATREHPQHVVLTMQLPPPIEGKRIFKSHDGRIEADIPSRDDLTWGLDALGCGPIAGRFADLAVGLDGGVLEIALPHDAVETQAALEEQARRAKPPPPHEPRSKPKGVRSE